MYAIIIMDGFAFTDESKGNAITASGIPNIKKLLNKYPHTTLGASGMSVGLPEGQMGNSEVGHVNIGAGRIVYQELTRITKEIDDGEFFKNPALNDAVDYCISENKSLHLYGLLSDGGVHSHIKHLYAILKLAANKGLKRVYVHCFMDGRDVSTTSGKGFIADLQQEMNKIGVGKIATVVGRYYAMDRDNRWERVKRAYDAMTSGIGILTDNPVQAMENSYQKGVTDEFIEPIVVLENGVLVKRIEQGDAIICFNFRPDRAREITRTFIQKDFESFDRATGYLKPKYVCFTKYDAAFENVKIAFPEQKLKNTLGEYLSDKGYTQLRIAETEKYAHVTFFFNGGKEEQYKNENRILVNSPKVATYDLKPEMSAFEVNEKAIEAVKSEKYDVMILNFANCDMVGHTGVFDAAVKAVKTVDECVGKLVDTILSLNGKAIITADHGNADKMLDDEGNPFTPHTTNRVPFILVDNSNLGAVLRNDGILADISPTLLDIMGLNKPEEMTGKSLIEKA